MGRPASHHEDRPIWLGAVAYDPKVVTIWEGMRRYFVDEAELDVEIILFQSYEAQVAALLATPENGAPRIDIAWNINLAFIQAEVWSGHSCRPIAMRDTDIGWEPKFLATGEDPVASLADLKGRTIAIGSRDSGHAAILPLYYLKRAGLDPQTDCTLLRFDTDVGMHGDTGRSETEVLAALLDGRATTGAVGSPFWQSVRDSEPAQKLVEIWTSPPFNHCMFTARADLSAQRERRFTEALYAMDFDNPGHRVILEAEGLRKWLPPQLDGYSSLREAAQEQGMLG